MSIEYPPQIWFDSKNKQGKCFGFMFGDLKTTTKALIVLQEWWGVTPFMLKEAKEFAEKGPFVTFLPDLYRGKQTQDYETAGHYMDTLDWEGAMLDVIGAAEYLLAHGCTKVGVTGFCMGGALSLAVASKVSEQAIPVISASAPFYGIPKPELNLADLRKIRIPLQCHFGREDQIKGLSAPEDQEKLKRTLDEGGVKYDFYQYEGARHAFMDYDWIKYHEPSRKLAVPRLIDFMNQHLT